MLRNSRFFEKKQGFMRGKQGSNERGSAIIWVFIMIALFAALSFAVSDGSRSGETTISKEQADLAATEILDYAGAVKRAVQELQINGCSDTEISFENALVAAYSTVNGRAPNDESCHIFKSNGANLRYSQPQSDWFDSSFAGSHDTYGQYHFSAHHCVVSIGTHDDPCPEPSIELTISTAFLKKDVCMALNKRIGLEAINDFIIKEGFSFSLPTFNGVYGIGSHVILGDQEPKIAGKMAACVQDNGVGFGDDGYFFYQVLIAR